MTGNPFAPKTTETQREEALRRSTGGESLNRIAKDYRAGSAANLQGCRRLGLTTCEIFAGYSPSVCSPSPGPSPAHGRG